MKLCIAKLQCSERKQEHHFYSTWIKLFAHITTIGLSSIMSVVKGTVSGPAAALFQEVDVNTYREARHKDACLQHKGRLLVCPECKQRFSPEEVIRATCSRIQNSVRGDSNLTEPTIGHDKELPKAWIDIAALRYPYGVDDNGCTIGNKGAANESWLHNKDMRSVLVHLRFDQHAQLYCPTRFKKSA